MIKINSVISSYYEIEILPKCTLVERLPLKSWTTTAAPIGSMPVSLLATKVDL